MPFITREDMRERRLPRGGRPGVHDSDIDLAIEAAIERVSGLTGDTLGTSALVRSAVADLAEASLLDIINPRDARDRESAQSVLRQAAMDSITNYLDIKRNTEGDQDTRWTDVPSVSVKVVDPPYFEQC